MAKIPRVRERTATPAELEEDRERCQQAKPRRFASIEEFEAFARGEPPTPETTEALRAAVDSRQALLDALDTATALTLGVR
jgi:hypothetical protein